MILAAAPVSDVLGLLIPWLIVGGLCCWILFKDSLDKLFVRKDGADGSLPTYLGWWGKAVLTFGGLALYAAIICLPLLGLIELVGLVNATKKEGLTPQELSQAKEISRNQRWFEQLPPLLADAASKNDMADPAWIRLKAYVLRQMGSEQRFGRNIWQALIDWGKEVGQRAGRRPEDLSEAEAIRTALTRIMGNDGLPERVKKVRVQVRRERPHVPHLLSKRRRCLPGVLPGFLQASFGYRSRMDAGAHPHLRPADPEGYAVADHPRSRLGAASSAGPVVHRL
jgi:hypothetical protein